MALFRLFRELWYYAGEFRWRLAVAIILHALSTISILAGPYIFAQILNVFQLYEDKLLERVLFWFGMWALTWLWFNLTHRFGRFFELSAAYKAEQNFINDHYRIVTRLPLSWHQDHHSGDIINRINLAGTSLREFGELQFRYVQQIFMMFGPLVALCWLSWEVAMLSVFVSVLTIFIINKFDKRLVQLYKKSNKVRHKVSAAVFDYISNIKTIITLRLGVRTGQELSNKIEAGYHPYIQASAIVDSIKWFFVSLSRLLTEGGIVLYYIWRELDLGEKIMIGNISAVFQYVRQLSENFMNIAMDYQQVIHRWTNFEEIYEIQKAARYDEEVLDINFKVENVSIENINFNYKQAEKPTLDNIDFAFNKGEKIAIIGESGSGKSTLLSILRGLYLVKKAKIKINGEKVECLGSLFPVTTLIPQEPEIFDETIKYNMTVGLRYSSKDIDKALSIAKFDSVIKKLPEGINTGVREKGVNLSGGEKQRLALARAILAAKDSQIILMDEPTSSVDNVNEVAIYKNVFKEFADKTVISTIHRLNLLEMFDRVIVIDAGRIVQQGSFKDLLAEKGLFTKLWAEYQKTLQH